MRALNPNLRQEDVETILCAAADDQVGDQRDVRGYDIYHGYGQLNIPAALMLLRAVPDITFVDGPTPIVGLRWPMPSNAQKTTLSTKRIMLALPLFRVLRRTIFVNPVTRNRALRQTFLNNGLAVLSGCFSRAKRKPGAESSRKRRQAARPRFAG